jgi:hypothetical protein
MVAKPHENTDRITDPSQWGRGLLSARALADDAEHVVQAMAAQGFAEHEMADAVHRIGAAFKSRVRPFGRIRLFEVHNLKTSAGSEPIPISVSMPTLRGYFRIHLALLKIKADIDRESMRREINAAREAAEDQNRTATERGESLDVLDALLAVAGSQAIDARPWVDQIPSPRVLSAGGQTCIHVPLN